MSVNQRVRFDTTSLRSSNGSCRQDNNSDSGIQNERIILLVFESIKWDVHALCRTASVNRRLRAMAKRLLWRELCLYRAPRMAESLSNGVHGSRMSGGWSALAKLLFFCCGCELSQNFEASQPLRGHFVRETRFSKTSGMSFLVKKCRTDLLYVSDLCEHPIRDKDDDLGVFRGVFRGFRESKTRSVLIGRQVALDEKVRCPYCGTRVWSMTTARLVPRNAALRLGSRHDELEYFVCVNGHLHGTCWLVPLSSDEDNRSNGQGDEGDDDHMDGSDGGDFFHPTVGN